MISSKYVISQSEYFLFLFRSSCYHLVDQNLNFQDAEEFCKNEFGGSLASITSLSKFDSVKGILDEFNLENIKAIFIGGIELTSRWSWTSGIEPHFRGGILMID